MLYRLFVSGPQASRERFATASLAGASVLASHIPMDEDLGYSERLEFARAAWGTCRRDHDPVVEADTGPCGFTAFLLDLGDVCTAPPLGLTRIFKMYPDLRFYFECVPDDEQAEELEAYVDGS